MNKVAFRGLLVLAAASSMGCGGSASSPLNLQTGAASAREVRADAPDGFTLQDLGVPLDANFNRMIGGGAGTMFPQAGQPTCSPMGGWSSERKVVETQEELSANAHAWGVVDANAEFGRGERYGYYRATLLTGSCQLRDNTPMNQPPPGAVYYASRLLVGHSYWMVVHGNSSSFNAGVSAEFIKWGASVDAFRQSYGLVATGRGKGLQPNSATALFSPPEQVSQNYRADRAPDAIVVIYRQLPGAWVNAGPVASASKTIDIRFTSLQVSSTGSSLKDYSNWTLTAQCSLNGRPYGNPVQVMNGRVSVGTTPIMFAQQIPASDADYIECAVDGTYTRGSWGVVKTLSMPRVSTGPIVVGRLPSASMVNGGDAETRFTIPWSATRIQ